jgi:SAM-dependent methyltransferase
MMYVEQPLVLRTESLDQCPICGGRNLRHIITAPDYESGSGEYGIDECADCRSAFTNPRPVEEELPKLYAQRDTTDFPNMGGLVRRLRDFTIDRYLAGQLDKKPMGGNGAFEALDYGCGDGALVRGLVRYGRKRGHTPHVTAVDFHETAPPAIASAAPAVTYVSNAAWHNNPGQYDAIFLRHVLEHHPQPLRLLGDLAAALKPDGTLHIEVPNRRSVWAGIFGRCYFGYYLPRHLYHFARASLGGVLRRAGFRQAAVRLAHHPMIGSSLRYLTGLGISNTGLVGLACYPIQVGLDMLCGRSTTLLAAAAYD